MGKDAGLTDGVAGAVLTSIKFVSALPLTVVYVMDSLIRSVIPRRFLRRDVTGDTVLITGGSSGLGRELAVRFARAGSYVIVWGRNKQGLDETCRQAVAAGGRCVAHVVDVTDRDAIYRTAQQIHREFGKVDILINNAGVVYGKDLLDTNDDDIMNTFNVNVISHFFTTKAFLPSMIRRNCGQIVTVSSLGGYQAVNKMTDYCASKFAAVGFNDSLSMELKANGNDGISTTLVCPYYIDTGMFSGIKSRLVPVMTPKYVADETMDAILMRKRYLTLPWVGSVNVFLATFLPHKLQYLLHGILGVTESLDDFEGRQQVTYPPPTRTQISG